MEDADKRLDCASCDDAAADGRGAARVDREEKGDVGNGSCRKLACCVEFIEAECGTVVRQTLFQ